MKFFLIYRRRFRDNWYFRDSWYFYSYFGWRFHSQFWSNFLLNHSFNSNFRNNYCLFSNFWSYYFLFNYIWGYDNFSSRL